MKRETEGLAVQALSKNNPLSLAIGEMTLNKGDRAHALGGFVGWTTADRDDSGTLCAQ